jgi:hypothetical protein
MKKLMCLSICVSLILLVAGGCASTPKGPTDQEVVQKMMKDCSALACAKDMDKFMTYFSDSFASTGAAYFDKAGFKGFLDDAKQSGVLDGLAIDLKDAKVTILKDTATVAPVHVSVSAGNPETAFTAKKENGVWKITGMEISGI